MFGGMGYSLSASTDDTTSSNAALNQTFGGASKTESSNMGFIALAVAVVAVALIIKGK